MTPVAFLDWGLGEMLVCGVVALLLFGGRLPEAMGRLGSVYRKVRRGVEDLKRTVDAPVVPPPPAPYRPSASAPLSQGVGEPPRETERPAPPAAPRPPSPPPAAPPAAPVAEDPPPV